MLYEADFDALDSTLLRFLDGFAIVRLLQLQYCKYSICGLASKLMLLIRYSTGTC